MKAKDVLLAMQAKYAAMHSYQDRGMVLTTFPDALHANEVSFATYFQRPNRFRFEWTTHHPYEGLRHILTHRVIWNIKSGAFMYSSRDSKLEPVANISIAIARATGVSSGAAHTITTMLMREVGGYRLPQLKNPTLTDGACEGVLCYRITGYDALNDLREVFIGVHDLLLRRVGSPNCGGVVSEETRRNIRVNQKINKSMFDVPSVSEAKS